MNLNLVGYLLMLGGAGGLLLVAASWLADLRSKTKQVGIAIEPLGTTASGGRLFLMHVVHGRECAVNGTLRITVPHGSIRHAEGAAWTPEAVLPSNRTARTTVATIAADGRVELALPGPAQVMRVLVETDPDAGTPVASLADGSALAPRDPIREFWADTDHVALTWAFWLSGFLAQLASLPGPQILVFAALVACIIIAQQRHSLRRRRDFAPFIGGPEPK